jgi:hypothetical protein
MSLSVIEKKLAQLRGHIRLMFLSWGLAVLLIWAAGLTLWLYYTDRILELPGGLRVGALVLAVLILVLVAVRKLVYPLSRTLSDEDLALLVEREYPLLNDRLITSLQLLKSQERYKDAASADMMRAVVSESFDIAGKLQFNEAVRSRKLLRVVGISVLAMLVVFGHAWFDRDDLSIWVRRALGSGPEWPTRTQLEVQILARDQMAQYPSTEELSVNFTFDPEARIPELGVHGVYEVAAGSDLRIIARPSGRIPDRAEVRITTWQQDAGTGRWSQVGSRIDRPMQRGALAGDQHVFFSYNKFAMIQPLEQITIRAGDAVAGPFTLRVIPAPELTTSVELSYTYPEYLVIPGMTTSDRAIEAVAGTQLDFTFGVSKPLQLDGPDGSHLIVDYTVGSSQRFPLDTDHAAGENRYKVRIPALQLGMDRWRLRLVDRQGIENTQRIGDRVTVNEDAPPVVRMLFSGEPLVSNQFVFATSDAVIPLEFEMTDDYGVGSARMFWRFSIDNEYTEFAPFAEAFRHLANEPQRLVEGSFELEFSRLLFDQRVPTGARVTIELYIQAFDLNQISTEEGAAPTFQGSRADTRLSYELIEVDDLRIRVGSQIRQIRTLLSAMESAQAELMQITRDALSQPAALDFSGDRGEGLRRDLNDAYRRQNQLLRDAELALERFGVFAQVYQFNRLEREDLARPQESRIQTVRLLLAIAAADRDLQSRVNNPMVRLQDTEAEETALFAREIVVNLNRRLRRALPDRGYNAESFGRLLQEHRLYTPGSLDHARVIYESVLQVDQRPSERRELLGELLNQQQLSLSAIQAVQQQVARWEGFDQIKQGFYNLLRNQQETNEDVAREARRGD